MQVHAEEDAGGFVILEVCARERAANGAVQFVRVGEFALHLAGTRVEEEAGEVH